MPGRLQITIDLSKYSEFMKFTVNLLQVPVLMNNFIIQDISKVNFELSGKDIVINWQFYDNFDTNGELWYDANGL